MVCEHAQSIEMELDGKKRVFCVACAEFLHEGHVSAEERLERLEGTLRWLCQRYLYSQALLHQVVESYKSHLEAAKKEREETEALRQRQKQHMDTMEDYAAELAGQGAEEAMERNLQRGF